MTRSNFSIGTFFIAFLIGATCVYLATPLWDQHQSVSHTHEHEEAEEHEHEEGEEHDHEHEEDEEHEHEHNHDSLTLNAQATANIGIAPGEEGTLTPTPTEFKKSFAFPGFVQYKPGRSLVDVPSSVAGVISRIYAEEGDALCPGEPLFDIQLTHEELTSCQLELLALLQKRDVLESEKTRLEKLDEGIEPKTRREIALQISETDAAIEAQKQALRFLGAPSKTIEESLMKKRELLTSLTIRVPSIGADGAQTTFESIATHEVRDGEHFRKVEHFLQLEKLFVEKGQTVSLGSSLCVVSDLRDLLIEGKAFESDEARVDAAYAQNARVKAVFQDAFNADDVEIVDNLTIRSVANRLDATARTLSCYVELKNYLLDSLDDERTPYRLNWRFKPGSRCELNIETETLSDVFVLPTAAVATDGAEAFVFEYGEDEDGETIWTKRPVVVRYRTAREVVIANDGSIASNSKIAKSGAFQLYVALNAGNGKLQSSCSCGHDH